MTLADDKRLEPKEEDVEEPEFSCCICGEFLLVSCGAILEIDDDTFEDKKRICLSATCVGRVYDDQRTQINRLRVELKASRREALTHDEFLVLLANWSEYCNREIRAMMLYLTRKP